MFDWGSNLEGRGEEGGRAAHANGIQDVHQFFGWGSTHEGENFWGRLMLQPCQARSAAIS